MFRLAPPTTPLTLKLFDVKIHRDETSRVDKYRAGGNSPTSLFLATLQDAGNTIEVVAKVIIFRSNVIRQQTFDARSLRTINKAGYTGQWQWKYRFFFST